MNLRCWAIVDNDTKKALCVKTTRKAARSMKKTYANLGITTKIAKLSFEKFIR